MGALRHRTVRIRNPASASAAAPTTSGYGGATSNRANVVAPVTYPGTRFQWFSTSSFAKPGPLQWGTAARNDVVSPGRNNWNMALFKAFQVKENARFEFRAETFNTFNHTQFSSPNTSGNSAQLRTDDGHLQPAHLPARREVPVLIGSRTLAPSSPAIPSPSDRPARGSLSFCAALTPAAACSGQSAQSYNDMLPPSIRVLESVAPGRQTRGGSSGRRRRSRPRHGLSPRAQVRPRHRTLQSGSAPRSPFAGTAISTWGSLTSNPTVSPRPPRHSKKRCAPTAAVSRRALFSV